jgi:dihydroorotase
MLEAMKAAAREGVIIAAHCEDNTLPGIDPRSEWGQIERDLELCARTGCHYHVCHISSRESVRLIREAKARGVNVTCETAPHYLTLCQEDVKDEGRFKMNPPIRSAEDREALIEGLADGTIDVIATDHAPHTAEEKSRGFAGSAMGIVGLETSFPVLYTRLVRTGRISLERLVDAMSTAPRRIFGLPATPQDSVTIDLNTPFIIDSTQFASMGHSTPFDGWEVYGRVLETRLDGQPVYQWKNSSIQ